MAKPKTTETKIDQLIPDNINANKGTEYGNHLIEKSLREFGAGRSILLDKNNRIIAGNKTIENASAIGLENVIIVETTGDQIVAVKRMDVDLDSKKGRELAIADNASAKASIQWDNEAIQQIVDQWEVAPEDWGINIEIEDPENDPFDDKGIGAKSQYGVIVMCESEAVQEATFKALQELGYTCKVVVV